LRARQTPLWLKLDGFVCSLFAISFSDRTRWEKLHKAFKTKFGEITVYLATIAARYSKPPFVQANAIEAAVNIVRLRAEMLFG
jgi:hypothetical protein